MAEDAQRGQKDLSSTPKDIFKVKVTNLIQQSEKKFPSNMTTGTLISDLKYLGLAVAPEIRLEYESKILEDNDKELSEFVSPLSPEIKCLCGIKIRIFSKRQERKEPFIVWEKETVTEMLERLRTHPYVQDMRDAVIVDEKRSLSKCEGLATEMLRENCLVEVVENVIKVCVQFKTFLLDKYSQNREMFLFENQTVMDIVKILNLSNTFVIHEGIVTDREHFWTYENETTHSLVHVSDSGQVIALQSEMARKGMTVVLDSVPKPIPGAIPVFKAVSNVRYFFLDRDIVLETDYDPRLHLSYRAFLYGCMVRRIGKRLPQMYFRTVNGYTTLYDKGGHKTKEDLRRIQGELKPFTLFIQEDEVVRNELTVNVSNTHRKVKVWIFFDDIWVQRLIPYKACRHFIPE